MGLTQIAIVPYWGDWTVPFSLFKKRKVVLEEFPSLFQMEGHTGGFGLLFSLGWFVGITVFTQNTIIIPVLFGFAAFIAGAFGLLSWLSFWLGDKCADRIADLAEFKSDTDRQIEKARLELTVRRRITSLSIGYVIVCCVLIWLTGGLLSPFIPFYIMIFTLTIEKCDVPNPGIWVLLFFTTMALLSFSVYSLWTPPIASNVQNILQSTPQKLATAFFVVASLAVPVVSKHLLAIKEARKQRLRTVTVSDPTP